LRKFYKSSASAIIICNTTKVSYWFNNITELGLNEQDIINDAGASLFGKPIYQLLPGEYILSIDRRAYSYTIKTLLDRATNFVVAEIRLESVNSSFINSNEIANIFLENDSLIKKNARQILTIVENTVDTAPISQEDYKTILRCANTMIGANRSLASVIETKQDCKNVKLGRNNISSFAAQFVENCEPIFKTKNLEISLNCVEDIYGRIGQASFNNLCSAILNRLICISDGYVDKFTISLDMLGDNILDLCIFTSSTTNTLRVHDMQFLKERLKKRDTIGTDLFTIKYFCENYGAEASQRITSTGHSATINIKIPKCETEGVMLFKNHYDKQELDKESNLYVDLIECLSNID
jgi:hypothetical protein